MDQRGGLYGSAAGSGTSGLPGPRKRADHVWLLVIFDNREVCFTRDGPQRPLRRSAVRTCATDM
jgi:hypothetical protein